MPLTDAQRAAINRQNAAKSTGPKTDEGKAASRQNATKHGLRAEVVALPNEDPDVVAARSEAWNDYYRPRSPGAQHLVNECVAATLLSDRCHKYHNAALSEQVRNAERNWDNQRADAVQALSVLLKTDPALAVHRLKQTAHGLRWMVAEWSRLLAALVECRRWTDPELGQAIRLMGHRPEPEHMRESAAVWYLRFLNLFSRDVPDPDAEWLLFLDEYLPNLDEPRQKANRDPDRDRCRREIREVAAEEIERLRVALAALQEGDELDRAESGARAMVLSDPTSARLFLRYHSEARNSFHRSYAALLKTLERDAEGPDAPPETDSPNEADLDANPAHETPPDPHLGEPGAASGVVSHASEGQDPSVDEKRREGETLPAAELNEFDPIGPELTAPPHAPAPRPALWSRA